jgi:hypothetical protein
VGDDEVYRDGSDSSERSCIAIHTVVVDLCVGTTSRIDKTGYRTVP